MNRARRRQVEFRPPPTFRTWKIWADRPSPVQNRPAQSANKENDGRCSVRCLTTRRQTIASSLRVQHSHARATPCSFGGHQIRTRARLLTLICTATPSRRAPFVDRQMAFPGSGNLCGRTSIARSTRGRLRCETPPSSGKAGPSQCGVLGNLRHVCRAHTGELEMGGAHTCGQRDFLTN